MAVAVPSKPEFDPRDAKRANYAAYLSNAGAGAVKVSHKPVQLFLEITSRCNLRCGKCGFAWDPSLATSGQDIPWPLLARMEDFFAAATEVYTFGYGEMFLYPELAPLVTVLKGHHCRVSGVTNGTLIRPADVVWMVACGYDHLAFSIDGGTEETMQRLRGASLEKILRTLRLIHEEKERRRADLPRVVVNFVAQADNYRELPGLVRLLAPLGIYFLGVNPLHHFVGSAGGYARYYSEFSLGRVERSDFESHLQEARAIAESAGIQFQCFVNPAFEWPQEARTAGTSLHVLAPAPPASASVAPESPEGLPSMYCHYPWTTLYLSARGKTRVCCYMSPTVDLGSFTGDGGLEAAWNGEDLRAVREAIRDGRVHPACTECVAHRSFESHEPAMVTIGRELAPEPIPTAPIEEPQPRRGRLTNLAARWRRPGAADAKA